MIDTRKIAAGETITVSEITTTEVPAAFGILGGVDVAINAALTSTGKGFTLEGSGCCSIQVLCGGCLVPIKLSLDFPIMENYVEDEPDDDDIVFSDKLIDLQSAALRNLLLNIPMAVWCKDDCAGLCPTCGCNLNESDCNCTVVVNEQFLELMQMFDKSPVCHSEQSEES